MRYASCLRCTWMLGGLPSRPITRVFGTWQRRYMGIICEVTKSTEHASLLCHCRVGGYRVTVVV